ncbi:MAG TPA: D-2-hydroxyacid dehydrogenase, partial [Acidobacteria bacterium]|nr:D-2-hydroxyacid dehydrogenase [Acidobacteriota bacterium]
TALLNYVPSPEHRCELEEAAPGWRLVPAATEEEALRAAPEAEVILGNRYFLQVLPEARRLRWMQSNSVGMDLILADPLARQRDFVLTNARGVYDDEMADHALALALALVRGVGAAARAMVDGGWRREPLPVLRDLPALIFGFGGVGRAIARRLLAFGCTVTAVRRSAGGPAAALAQSMGVRLVPAGRAKAALESSRLVFLALPLTPETRGLFGRDLLRRLPDGAHLVNVARGPLLDEEALRHELPRLGGVALDVFATEPLPSDHWLRHAPNVVLTPHVGRSPEGERRRWAPLFVENLRRWAAGEPLLNVVDKEFGY